MVQWKEHQLRFVLAGNEYVPLVPLELSLLVSKVWKLHLPCRGSVKTVMCAWPPIKYSVNGSDRMCVVACQKAS